MSFVHLSQTGKTVNLEQILYVEWEGEGELEFREDRLKPIAQVTIRINGDYTVNLKPGQHDIDIETLKTALGHL